MRAAAEHDGFWLMVFATLGAFAGVLACGATLLLGMAFG